MRSSGALLSGGIPHAVLRASSADPRTPRELRAGVARRRSASYRAVQDAITRLVSRGYLIQQGAPYHYTYALTPAGEAELDRLYSRMP